MLSTKERDDLHRPRALLPPDRARLFYRVAGKAKDRLSELSEIDEALRLLPTKNAKILLDDKMVTSVLMLAESMIEILGYAPIVPIPGRQPVIRVREPLESEDPKFKKTVETERLATTEDAARILLLKDHIETLQKFIGPVDVPLCGSSEKLPYVNTSIYEDGYKLFRKWRPDPADLH